MGENYYSFHKQEWKTITRLAAKQVRMHVNRAHIDWVHVMHIQAQARKRLIYAESISITCATGVAARNKAILSTVTTHMRCRSLC